MRARHIFRGLVMTMVIAGCAGSSGATTTAAAPTVSTAPGATDTQPTPTTIPPTSTQPTLESTTTTITAGPAMEMTGDTVTIHWENLAATPFFAPASGGVDPHFWIHTYPDQDGFFLSFEMYTTGYGQEWTGQTGTFDISCDDPVNSTGICPYFDPDGPGPEPVKGDDFAAAGSLTIDRLDDGGYDITVHDLVFSDGTMFNEFVMTG